MAATPGIVARDRIADTLAEIPDRGIIHRDVNPASILLDPDTDELELADFGSSAPITSDPTMPGSTSATSCSRSRTAADERYPDQR